MDKSAACRSADPGADGRSRGGKSSPWLSSKDLAAIEKVASRGVAAGERYGPAGMANVNICSGSVGRRC